MFKERKILSAGLILTIMTAEVAPYALDKYHLQHLDEHRHPREAEPQSLNFGNIMAIGTTASTVAISGDYIEKFTGLDV